LDEVQTLLPFPYSYLLKGVDIAIKWCAQCFRPRGLPITKHKMQDIGDWFGQGSSYVQLYNFTHEPHVTSVYSWLMGGKEAQRKIIIVDQLFYLMLEEVVSSFSNNN